MAIYRDPEEPGDCVQPQADVGPGPGDNGNLSVIVADILVTI